MRRTGSAWLGSTFARTHVDFGRREEAGGDVAVEKAVPFQVDTDPRRILGVDVDHVQFGPGGKRLLRLEVRAWPAPQLQTAASDHDISPGREPCPCINGAGQL